MIVALTISGVVIVAIVLLVAAALFLGAVVLERRGRPTEQYAHFLDGLRRIRSRVRS